MFSVERLRPLAYLYFELKVCKKLTLGLCTVPYTVTGRTNMAIKINTFGLYGTATVRQIYRIKPYTAFLLSADKRGVSQSIR